MWMKDSYIYISYKQARDPSEQLSILAQLNGCDSKEIKAAVSRYESYLKNQDKIYAHELEKAKSNRSRRFSKNSTGGAKSMPISSKRHEEPTPGISVKKQHHIGVLQKDADSHSIKKSSRGPDTSIRWRKRTVITSDHDKEWNSLIDSMREHLRMAKECEKQLIKLEKSHGSHRRRTQKK